MSVKFDFKGLDEPFERLWPVSVNVPQDGGKVQVQQFNARFRSLTKEKIEELNEDDNPDSYLMAFFVGLPEGELPDGMTFEEVLPLMLARPNVRMALISAFTQFQQGVAAKN